MEDEVAVEEQRDERGPGEEPPDDEPLVSGSPVRVQGRTGSRTPRTDVTGALVSCTRKNDLRRLLNSR